jgi:hypothetical protein
LCFADEMSLSTAIGFVSRRWHDMPGTKRLGSLYEY